MCVLMLFNACEGLSYKEIEDATDIPALELKRSLQSLALVKGRNVLRKEPSGKDVSETDVFYVNDKFTSKTFKVLLLSLPVQAGWFVDPIFSPLCHVSFHITGENRDSQCPERE